MKLALLLAMSLFQMRPPMPGRLVDAGGYRVHLNCTGSGGPAVLIVGAGFSFDWVLVQPEVARFTRVCTYDAGGMAWSDPSPSDSCDARVAEIHALVKEPVVLVGHSIGAVFARLYADRYPKDVVGMVLVDHAARFRATRLPGPGVVSFENDPAFQKLPVLNRDLHRWAASLKSPAPRAYDQCMADAISAKLSPEMPLVVVSTALDAPEYVKIQADLLALSQNSRQLIAGTSGHNVTIDQPEVIVDAIRRVVRGGRM